MLDFGYYNMDCMKGMKEFPDKYFDLAIVDPPYGGGGGSGIKSQEEDLAGGSTNTISVKRTGGTWAKKYRIGGYPSGDKTNANITHWDFAPDKSYFDELFRVSKNQIIWGGNYFYLPPTRCFLVWRKISISENFSMAMCEYAWTSFNDNAKVFECVPQGNKNMKRFHPTQKPIALYEWILNRYAKEGDIILDTHVGSASSLIACYRANHKYVGFELDEQYYKLSKQRLSEEMSQMRIQDL